MPQLDNIEGISNVISEMQAELFADSKPTMTPLEDSNEEKSKAEKAVTTKQEPTQSSPLNPHTKVPAVKEDAVISILEELNIKIRLFRHVLCDSVMQVRRTCPKIRGQFCKTVLGRDAKDKLFLVVGPEAQHINIQLLAENAKLVSPVHYCAWQIKFHKLRPNPGCLSPFHLVNDPENEIAVFIDKSFQRNELLCLPFLSRKSTISMRCCELERFCQKLGFTVDRVELDFLQDENTDKRYDDGTATSLVELQQGFLSPITGEPCSKSTENPVNMWCFWVRDQKRHWYLVLRGNDSQKSLQSIASKLPRIKKVGTLKLAVMVDKKLEAIGVRASAKDSIISLTQIYSFEMPFVRILVLKRDISKLREIRFQIPGGVLEVSSYRELRHWLSKRSFPIHELKVS